MIYLRLFYEFFKTGLFAVGGGMATIPFLYNMADATGWFTRMDVDNMIAVGESTPGPIGVNMATYVGYLTGMSEGGLPFALLGAVVATLGLITPSIIVILIIASFNIISTLSLLIIEKEDSINVLYALGATRSNVNRIFVIQGWLISIFGGIAGVISGSVLVLAQQWGKFIKLGGNPAQMSISVYPVRLDPVDLLQVIAVVTAVGILTGLVTLAVRKTR